MNAGHPRWLSEAGAALPASFKKIASNKKIA
jgi:hypothetical protein